MVFKIKLIQKIWWRCRKLAKPCSNRFDKMLLSSVLHLVWCSNQPLAP